MSANQLDSGDLIRIPGGEFLMGQADGRDEEQPVHAVALAPFRICRYPVTNAHWEHFRKAAGREQLSFTHATAPAASVNWFDAMAFCHWLSTLWSLPVRLPTEAEWEFAARGGAGQQTYPWGGESRPYTPERWRDGPEPVAQEEANGYGLFDMCQNVHEWCADWYDPQYYAISPKDNPRGPEHGKRRASRGGAWRHQIKCSRCAARSSIPPEFRYADYGFRVAADE
ncbi:MAG TPA: SUMF1/EgtB/PvdO family nonheme iron enzyme [Bryobacteraceae bacterium]|jgi:formylglycine-generating enzyme required for sulfatase activity|nr:SUMF1/EgtB/PvdO family nonheme iron enzyme [Bryobacteraceae bacterium]